ncbi:hypothetical protein [Fibrobacter sp.]|uniref:hypothetical protein n=1 Tax=Fibrobacter sp. TaxID=35828 RepID=UPI003890D750
MEQRNRSTRALLHFGKGLAALFSCTLVAACLDAPSYPNTSKKIERIGIFVSQEDISDSTLLKIHPSSEATLRAEVYPRQYKKEISFKWYHDDTKLGSGDSFSIPPYASSKEIPNILKATDQEGNVYKDTFNIVSNTPPHFDEKTSPVDNDTLCANKRTSISFSWNSYDVDYSYGDKNFYTLIIDKEEYFVGSLTSVMQSGFSDGKHSFSVIVADSYGDSDTLQTRTFFISDCSGER